MITFIMPLFDKYSCNFYIFSQVSPKIGWMSSVRDSLKCPIDTEKQFALYFS